MLQQTKLGSNHLHINFVMLQNAFFGALQIVLKKNWILVFCLGVSFLKLGGKWRSSKRLSLFVIWFYSGTNQPIKIFLKGISCALHRKKSSKAMALPNALIIHSWNIPLLVPVKQVKKICLS